jgi:hypothetical protein
MTDSKEQKIPQHVIRFYGKPEYALECIALKQITFLHLEKLNDPFDPVLDNITDFNGNYASLLSHVQEHHTAQLALFKEKLPEQNWEKVVGGWLTMANKMREMMFIFSTCEVIEGNHPRDNLYMWGHYGNGHRGVAIEFDTTVLAESLRAQDAPDGDPPWCGMDYKEEIPKIKCEDIYEEVMNPNSNPNNLKSPLACCILQKMHSKGKVWERENEWRLIRVNDETKLKIYRDDIPDNAITAVYLGCRAAEQEQVCNDFVYEIKRNFPNASVFRAKMSKGEYALYFDKIA